MGREIEPFLSGRGWKKAACVGWMDFQPRIDNNCLNQPRAGPFLAPAPRHSRALPTAGDGEEGGFERNERQRSIPFVESRARAWRIYDPCHCLYSETPLHALSLLLSTRSFEHPRLFPIHPLTLLRAFHITSALLPMAGERGREIKPFHQS